jgi:hypothetical protein
VPKLIKQRKRAAEALKRLKVRPEDVANAPQITPLLRNAEGGLTAVITAMRFAPHDEVISAFLKKYDAIPAGDRERLPWEAIALAAKIEMNQLLGSIMFAIQALSVNMVKIIALTSHPLITQARIKYAQLPSGDRDRTAIDTALGFLPSPKGPTFIGKAVFGSQSTTSNSENAEAPATFGEDDDLDDLFPSCSTMQEKLLPIRQRQLTS